MASYDEESHNQLSDGNHTGVVNETEYFKKTDFENSSNQKGFQYMFNVRTVEATDQSRNRHRKRPIYCKSPMLTEDNRSYKY
ncbi:hypothetical protein FPSE_08355 [Fusarium pseudograminearum CS3096]|uniref:Uncharacterized protein n=1 Tax=Fusarium pseudograminearum (strain CS3096) TaxID=1028729 RepID=K3VC35_FUSPC|nr:hypothetical protein FPSE_08355 [Fusarium pseudograminearum CS3096]EKJ71422.1 hypothetical protein FPSE_08355 [Fusarium pseudograminearum CS3096]